MQQAHSQQQRGKEKKAEAVRDAGGQGRNARTVTAEKGYLMAQAGEVPIPDFQVGQAESPVVWLRNHGLRIVTNVSERGDDLGPHIVPCTRTARCVADGKKRI
jgi:hypothetical protein